MSLNKVLGKVLADQEKKSWKVDERVYYEIFVHKRAKNDQGYYRSECFSKRIVEQSNKYPSGISKEMALKIAGQAGTVWKITTTRKRLK